MTFFIKKIFGFILFGTVLISVLCIINSLILEQAINQAVNISETENIIIGDSHVELGVNPNKLKNCINIANSSEPYSMTYYKLKFLLNYPNNIKNIVLGFSYHNFEQGLDSITIDKNNSNYTTFVKRYILLNIDDDKIKFSRSEFSLFNKLKWNYGFPSSETFSFNLKYLLKNRSLNNLPFIGSYKRFEKSDIKTHKNIIKNACLKFKNQNQNSSLQKKYLFKIFELLKRNNIDLYLIGTPLMEKYKECMSEYTINDYQNLSLELNELGAKVYDFTDLKLKSAFFKDPHHLSAEGSDYFTEMFIKKLTLE